MIIFLIVATLLSIGGGLFFTSGNPGQSVMGIAVMLFAGYLAAKSFGWDRDGGGKGRR
jgi:hypothetical protein